MFGIYMHFWLVLACDAHCLAYFPYAYRVVYFLFVIIHIYVLLSVCALVYSMTPCKFVCGFGVQYSIGVEYSIYRCTVARGIVSVYCVLCCAENRPV